MPATKENIAVFTAAALSGGGGPTDSAWQNLQTAYGGVWQITVTNNAVTKQAKGVQIQVQVAPDQVAGNDFNFDCRQIASQEISAVSKFVVRVPPECQFTRLHVTHGNEAATISAIFTRLTQV